MLCSRSTFALNSPRPPDELLGLHPADFLFAEHLNGKTSVLHVLHNGTPEWVEGRCAATGNGELFAHTLLTKYAPLLPLSRDKAKLLAYKVIEEAIQVGAYGLGAPIAVWEVNAPGVTTASREELQGLEDAAEMLREREVEMFADQPPAVPAPPAAQQAPDMPAVVAGDAPAGEAAPVPARSRASSAAGA